MRKLLFIVIALCCMAPSALTAQKATAKKAAPKPTNCQIVFDEIDEFDSLRLVGSKAMHIGLWMPSLYEEADGPRLTPEGKMNAVFTQNDSLNGIFINIVLPEYEYEAVENGFNVKLKLSNDTIIGFYTVPDKGTFEKETNMRHYQHTALVPVDSYYLLTTYFIDRIRVEYPQHRRTIDLTAEQKRQFREAMRCLGERIGLYPLTP